MQIAKGVEAPVATNGVGTANTKPQEQPLPSEPGGSLSLSSTHNRPSNGSAALNLSAHNALKRHTRPRRSQSRDGGIVPVATPRRVKSSDGTQRRMFSGLRGGRKPQPAAAAPQPVFGVAPLDAMVEPAVQSRSCPNTPQHSFHKPRSSPTSEGENAKNFGRARATVPGAVASATEPTQTTPQRHLSGDSTQSAAKMRSRTRATAPGAVRESLMKEPSTLNQSLHGSTLMNTHQNNSTTNNGTPGAVAESSPPSDGKMRGRARATAPGAVSSTAAAEPSLGASVHGTAPSLGVSVHAPPPTLSASMSLGNNNNDGKMRGRARATAPGAVSSSNTTEPSLGASVHGGMAPPALTPGYSLGDDRRMKSKSPVPHRSSASKSPVRRTTGGGGVRRAKSTDGTEPIRRATGTGPRRTVSNDGAVEPIRRPTGLRRATSNDGTTDPIRRPTSAGLRRTKSNDGTAEPIPRPAAVRRSMSNDGSTTATEGDGKIRRARASQPGAVSSEGASAAAEPALGASMHGNGISLQKTRRSVSPPPNGMDPQTIRMQEIMLDSSLSQPEKQAKIQQLMAQKEAPAPQDPQAIRKKQIQDIMKDSTLFQTEKHAKIQQLMAGGMPQEVPPQEAAAPAQHAAPRPVAPAPPVVLEDPQAIRRKQILEIQRDPSLTPKEKQFKMQQLMAGGMPKAAPVVAAPPPQQESAPPAEQAPMDPQAIRRKQILEIRRDPSLTPKEKQFKMQQLMASGMPKEAPRTEYVEETVEPQVPPAEVQPTLQEVTPEPSDDSATGSDLEEEDPDVLRTREIQEIMNDPDLTPREKLLKTQEVMANSLLPPVEAPRRQPAAQEKVERTSRRARSRANSPTNEQRGLRRTNTNESAPKPTGLRIRRTLSNDGTAPRSPRRTMSSDGSTNSPRRSPRRSRSRGGPTSPASPPNVPLPGSDLGEDLEDSFSRPLAPVQTIDVANTATVHSTLDASMGSFHEEANDSFHEDFANSKSSAMDASMNASAQNMNGSARSIGSSQRISRRQRIALMNPSTQDEAPQSSSRAVAKPGAVSVVEQSTPGAAAGFGGAPQGKMRRVTSRGDSRPGAVSIVEPSSSHTSSSTGVGGAPQGKFRRAATSPATRPGAVSVVEPSAASSRQAEPGASAGFGGAPEGKMRRTTTTPATRPGAVGVVEPSSSHTRSSTGFGGAPEGKMRRTTTTPATQPGAVSVVEPTAASGRQAEPGASAGFGGAPEGKFRRTATTPASRPGAVSMVEPAAASASQEPGASAGFGGAPQGKMRRTTTTPASRPGAVSVVEPAAASNHGEPEASSGFGGAPQGKARRTTSPVSRPGAVSVVEPSAPNSSTGFGGAPDGKMRRTTTTPATRPGAVSVSEPSAAANQGEPAASTGFGGAPQGKVRRTTAPTAVFKPGAVSVVDSTAPEPGASTGIGGAPQGKFRRAATTPVTRPGAVSVAESIAPEPGASTGIGGAPQGKVRRTTIGTNAPVMPGAQSVTGSQSNSLPSESLGVGGAPQGKMRRSTAQANTPGAVSVQEPAPSESVGVGGAPQGKFRRSANSQATRPGAVGVVEPSLESSHSGASSSVGGAPQGKFRRSTNSQATRPGAVGVVEPSLESSQSGASSSVGGAPQGKFRRTTAPAVPGAVAATDDPMDKGSQRSSVMRAGPGMPRQVVGMFNEPRTLVPAVSVRSMQASEHDSVVSSTTGASSMLPPLKGFGDSEEDHDAVIASIEQDMAAKNRARRTSAATPGAQSVASDGVSATDKESIAQARAAKTVERMNDSFRSDGSHGSHSQRGLAGNRAPSSRFSLDRSDGSHGGQSQRGLAGNRAPSSRFPYAGPSTRGLGNRSSVRSLASEVSDITEPNAIRRHTNRSAPKGGLLNSSQSSFASSQMFDGPDPAADSEDEDDYDQALALAEEDMQLKLNMRNQTERALVPGVQAYRAEVVTAQPHLHLEDKNMLLRKDPYDYESKALVPAYDNNVDHSIQKENMKIVSESAAQPPSTMQDRMEQKILQMEQEQRARDVKLEELEDMNHRRNGPDRRKISPNDGSSPFDGGDEESGPLENGFLNPDPEEIRRAEEDGLAIAIAVTDDDEPEVYDVELTMYDPGAKPPVYKNRRFQCYASMIFLVTLVIIIAVSAIAAQKGGEIILITQAPSSAPSSSPTTTRETAVRGELARVIGEFVNEDDSPYQKAMDWILYEDPMLLDEFSENLIQRYVLALFYYQTSQEGPWLSCNPPQEGENHTCPFYEHTRLQPNNVVVWEERNETEVRWLSERHECEWAEVLCHPETDGNVIAIDILGQNLTGTMPEELRHLERLMWLTLSFNPITGTIPEVYGEFPYLTIFEATQTFITGQIPGGFFEQQNLLQLNLPYNMITGTLPPEIGDLTTLHSFFFFNTLISGTLPTEMGMLEDVRNLWLYDNNLLSGTLPSELGELSLLDSLMLGANNHTGPLPSELGNLGNMHEFLFSGNDMGGTPLAEELYNMSSLVYLDITGANFGGTLSTNIERMTSLQGLKAAGNDFSGIIPSEFGLLSNLQLLWFHRNEDLAGDMPIEICQLRGPESLIFLNADCGGIEPRISCPRGCCTGCCDEFGQCQQV
ncbi:leucine Rich Repeat [Seminavis robusta]|uniref:Leucine Rich Repeat n=1 Tax=Seminavis robusta TaxID=568900 RepID=A0A9N8E664_9STRA|nr:leucine Rich Repeat [Seminavis robusta]|eukprot:Sro694_g188470.1 leucine Rich Repeat (2583) ;mRNA; r:20399-28445